MNQGAKSSFLLRFPSRFGMAPAGSCGLPLMHEKTGIGLAPLAAQRKMAHPPFFICRQRLPAAWQKANGMPLKRIFRLRGGP